ncbi:MAG: hypothetical protein ABIP51_12405 [Bacteroidia bacterium]
MIKFVKIFKSYEGEGPRIGMKTLFLTYVPNIGTLEVESDYFKSVGGTYINTEVMDDELYDFISKSKTLFTIEISSINFKKIDFENYPLSDTFFIRLEDDNLEELKNITSKSFINSMLKIEMKEKDNYSEKIKLANKYAENFLVYLMPLFKSNDFLEVGNIMMINLPVIHNNVRFMPPTQFLINIK